MAVLNFDSEAAERFVIQKKKIIGEFLDRHADLKTALDVGAGLGKFTLFLENKGRNTIAVEIRRENITEARKRYPDIKIVSGNIELDELSGWDRNLFGKDIVFALGLLYHLTDPLTAIKNLSLLGDLIFIETVILTNETRPISLLVDEPDAINQGVDRLAFIPSESCLVKMFSYSGFQFIYRRKVNETPVLARHRLILIAAKKPLSDPAFEEVQMKPSPKPNPYPRFNDRVRSLCRKIGSKSFWIGWDTDAY